MKKVFTALIMIVFVGAALVLFTSCSQEKASTPKKQTGTTKEKPKKETKAVAVKKACDVLSADEASTVVGTALVESSDPKDADIAPTGPEDSYCSYTNNGSTDDTRRKIFFSLALSSSANGAQMAFNATKNIAGSTAETVNIGDGAYWTPENGNLVAVRGRYQLFVHIYQPEKDSKDKAVAAAKVIIPRL